MSVGPWKDITLQTFSTRLGRIGSFYPRATLDSQSDKPHLQIELEIEEGPFNTSGRTAGQKWEVGLRLQSIDGSETLIDQRIPFSETGTRNLTIFDKSIPDAKKWWPVGYGDQTLYTVQVDIYIEVLISLLTIYETE